MLEGLRRVEAALSAAEVVSDIEADSVARSAQAANPPDDDMPDVDTVLAPVLAAVGRVEAALPAVQADAKVLLAPVLEGVGRLESAIAALQGDPSTHRSLLDAISRLRVAIPGANGASSDGKDGPHAWPRLQTQLEDLVAAMGEAFSVALNSVALAEAQAEKKVSEAADAIALAEKAGATNGGVLTNIEQISMWETAEDHTPQADWDGQGAFLPLRENDTIILTYRYPGDWKGWGFGSLWGGERHGEGIFPLHILRPKMMVARPLDVR